jgi:hypothetical protein
MTGFEEPTVQLLLADRRSSIHSTEWSLNGAHRPSKHEWLV